MSWRIVSVANLAKLDYKMDYLVIRTQDDTKRIHLSEIAVLLLESTAISLTAYLLCELSRRKIDVIFCDEKTVSTVVSENVSFESSVILNGSQTELQIVHKNDLFESSVILNGSQTRRR